MPAIRRYWSDWATRNGVAPQTVLASIHLTAEELIRRFAPGLDAIAEARATAIGQAQIETGITPLPGGRELVAQIPRERWAVVTSGRRELALRHLALGGLPVPAVLVTAEDTPRGKPDPAGYLLAAAGLGVAQEDCLAIEDSPAGVQAARTAGMTVLGVTNTHRIEELSGANDVIESLAELRIAIAGSLAAPELVVSLP